MAMSDASSILSASRPVMSVVTITNIADAVPLARALVAGGLPAIEVTLRTAAGLEAIPAIAAEVEGAIIGAGTVVTPADLAAVEKAGATFAISPGSTPALLAAGRDAGIPYIPAVATPSELMAGLDAGYSAFKLFPATVVGGVSWLKAIGGPFANVRFCPTGGIDLKTAPDFLALPNVMCVGGSWTTPAAAVAAGDWAGIESLAREARTALG
ncbi:MAG: keto-deoxy-phosphogluconate aldolase [Caulobacterales bacterium 68-7]|nr:MAG: keto-deoxy-phosphogluconate aldolase [Caulobacterales bacterium 68-7]